MRPEPEMVFAGASRRAAAWALALADWRPAAPIAPNSMERALSWKSMHRSLEGDEAFLLDDFLAFRREDPFDVLLEFAGRLARCVEVKLARNGILAVPRDLRPRRDGRLDFLF